MPVPVSVAMGVPQWSPPLIGGNTQFVQFGAQLTFTAAMEPAVDRREHTYKTLHPVALSSRRNGARR